MQLLLSDTSMLAKLRKNVTEIILGGENNSREEGLKAVNWLFTTNIQNL